MPLALLLFITVPLVEMFILIQVGTVIGAWPTIGLVVLTATIGLALLRRQGFATLARGMQRAESGELPAREMVEGLLLAVGGALLLTPGFVTDALGFSLLLPASRRALVDRVLRRVVVHGGGVPPGGQGPFGPGPGPGQAPGGPRRSGSDGPPPRRDPQRPVVIDGEFERRD